MLYSKLAIFGLLSSLISYFIYSIIYTPDVEYYFISIFIFLLFFYLQMKNEREVPKFIPERYVFLVFLAAAWPLIFIFIAGLLPPNQMDWVLYVSALSAGQYCFDLIYIFKN